MKKLCLMLVLLMAGLGQAATVSFTEKGWESGDLTTDGQIMAVNCGVGQNATVDGVTFVGNDNGVYSENGVSVSIFSGLHMELGGDLWISSHPDNYSGTTFPTVADAEALLDNLFGCYNPEGPDATVRFSGLTIGKTYELQLICVDGLPQNTERMQSIWSGDSPVGDPDVYADYSSRDDDLALLVTGTFTADATTQSLWMDFNPALGGAGWLNAMQLRMLPPSRVAGTPYPLNNQPNVPLDEQLSWLAPEAYTPTGYDVWFGTDPNNLSGGYDMEKIVDYQNVLTADPLDHSSLEDDMDYGITYYWRVDAYDPNDGNPHMYQGNTWSFSTEPPYPVITDQPEGQSVFPDESAVFTVVAYDPQGTALSYQWYDPNDIPVGTDSPTLTLTPPLSSAQEGDYYCVVTNEGSQSTSSEMANLLLKKLVGRWEFDGDATDSSGVGNDGVLYGGPTEPNYFVPGVNGVGQAIFFDRSDGINNGCYIPEVLFDSIGPDQVTISLWAYGGDNQPIKNSIFSAITPVTRVTVFNVNLPSVDSLWQDSYVSWAAGNHAAAYDRINKFAVADEYKGRWNHWVFTKNAATGEMRIHLNGVLWHQGTGKAQQRLLATNLYIGNGTDPEFSGGKYDGAIDDFRIYNYELTPEEIADLYFETSTETQVCLNPLEFDISGPAGEPDCVVDLYDIAAIAASWLEVGLYTANP